MSEYSHIKCVENERRAEGTSKVTRTFASCVSKNETVSAPSKTSNKSICSNTLVNSIDMKFPGVLLQTRKLLIIFSKENGTVELTRYPREHHNRFQTHLMALDFYRGIKSSELTQVLVREGIENLWYLLEYCKKDDFHAARVLGNQAEKLVVIMERVGSLLEEYSGVKATNWLRVADLFCREATLCVQDGPPYSPAKLKFFKLDILLGAGGFGAVFKAFLGNIACTLKFVPCERLLEPKFACMDKLVASMVNHPFIVKYYASFATKESFVTCMEYIKGCDLNKVLTMAVCFPEQITRVIIAQLGEALAHLHTKGFVHRDVKPANLMILSGCRIKLIDFDTAKPCIGKYVVKEQSCFNRRTAFEFHDNEIAGTLPYFPPECCPINAVGNNTYGRSMDWWAVGVTTFQLSTGHLPFHNFKTEQDLRLLINQGVYRWPTDRVYSSRVVQFVSELLNHQPEERLCSKQYADFRNHNYFTGLDWQMLMHAESLKEFPIIEKCMTKTENGFSPVGSPEAQMRMLNLFPQPMRDTTDHANIYTYCSAGFCRAVAEIKSGRMPTFETIKDSCEFYDESGLEYRFENI